MPMKNGLQVWQELKEFYADQRKENQTLVEPVYVFLTAYKTPTFEKYLRSIGVEHCYEKPLDIETLVTILKIAQQA